MRSAQIWECGKRPAAGVAGAVCRDQWSSKLNQIVQFLRSSISGEILLENGPQPAVHGLVLVRGPFGCRPHRKNKYLYFVLLIISSWMMFYFEKFPVSLHYIWFTIDWVFIIIFRKHHLSHSFVAFIHHTLKAEPWNYCLILNWS